MPGGYLPPQKNKKTEKSCFESQPDLVEGFAPIIIFIVIIGSIIPPSLSLAGSSFDLGNLPQTKARLTSFSIKMSR